LHSSWFAPHPCAIALGSSAITLLDCPASVPCHSSSTPLQGGFSAGESELLNATLFTMCHTLPCYCPSLQDEFSAGVSELSKSKLEKPKRLSELAGRWWNEIYAGTYLFDRQVCDWVNNHRLCMVSRCSSLYPRVPVVSFSNIQPCHHEHQPVLCDAMAPAVWLTISFAYPNPPTSTPQCMSPPALTHPYTPRLLRWRC
jgi:hypothetical protein